MTAREEQPVTWNYRIIYHVDASAGPWYGLHLVRYREDGSIFSWSEQPVSFKSDEGEDAIAAAIEMAVEACQRPTLTLNRKDWKIS